MVEAGIAGAEVVERDADAGVAQGAQGELGRLHVLHQGALGDLDLQAAGTQAALAKDRHHPQPEGRVAQQHRGDVDRKAYRRRPGHGLPA